MTEFITNLAISIFKSPQIATVFISMFPIIEVKGGIPFGTSTQIWGHNALNGFEATLYALLGGVIISLILLSILKPVCYIFRKLPILKKLMYFIDNKYSKKAKELQNKSLFKTYVAILIFVAVPFPLTGIWSACLISSLLELDIFKSLVAITLGNVFCAGLVGVLSTMSGDYSIYIFYAICLLSLLNIVYYLARSIIINKKVKL